MATRMLIDARHPEETRVAVLQKNRIEEFDFESADHKQIKGNIYLAKVTRVEPSLQAAFVDFGGNRHGFLAFSEIHPDYYQIPKEDREALIAADAEAAAEEARLRDEEEASGKTPGDEYDAEDDESAEALAEDLAEDGLEEIDTSEKDKVSTIEEGESVNGDDDDDDDSDEDEDNGENGNGRSKGRRGRGRRRQGGGGPTRAKEVDEAREKRRELRRRYKIQDVIQRRQVLLVQVVKEERGNKGAALTTYLSLAGRYTVLMPNSSHGGGISRKIASTGDRKRLKQVVSDLNLPRSMGLIVRTAGMSRTKTEIKRDFDYLARLWDEIREKTLSSAAPALIHSDSDLIKRAIRDLYNREIEEVIVEGEEGYKSAKAFMKMLMPSHARRVKAYSDPVPLFQRYGAEDQLRAMYDPEVQLKSGGYLVINPTEALVSIDINSGRSTKEHGIEQTATATNLEAAREIARQLRLRDMAGLIVIDFIDMDYNSNVRKVEKAMKEALKSDRARIQVGRISGFGLMEMSRQRLRTGVLEASTRDCPHCDGTGLVRTASSAGLSALRLIEDEAAKGKGSIITLAASTEAAVYLLNSKRDDLVEIEKRYGVTVQVVPEGEDEGAKMNVSSSGPRPTQAPKFDPIVDDDDDDDLPEDYAEDEDEEDNGDDNGDNRGDRSRKKRRRRGGRGRNRNDERNGDTSGNDDDDNDSDDDDDSGRDERQSGSDDDDDGKPRKKRRRRGGRGRRGGRNRNSGDNGNGESDDSDNETGNDTGNDDAAGTEDAGAESGSKPKPRSRRRAKADEQAAETVSEHVKEDMAVVAGPGDAPETAEKAVDEAEAKPKKRAPRKKAAPKSAPAAEAETAEEEAKPKRRAPRKKAVKAGEDTPAPSAKEVGKAVKKAPAKKVAKQLEEDIAVATGPEGTPETAEAAAEKDAKPRRGWWQRTFGE
ncbi:ribonuclease E/G [Qipengyuania sp. JC766]|uniref:Rne/Rng family ribonuclease n=1 Tax=Qipengyuania sp. JC766 TaxID=3232139 RepID=UPI00345B2D3C